MTELQHSYKISNKTVHHFKREPLQRLWWLRCQTCFCCLWESINVVFFNM